VHPDTRKYTKGAAFPFDTLKTKAQTYKGEEGEVRQALGMVAIAQRVVETEGLSGFYGGVLQCAAVYCGVLQKGAVCSRVLQCVAVCCRRVQCVAVCCSVV